MPDGPTIQKTSWQERKKIGRPKALKSPEELWQHACDYFQQCDEHPWQRTDFRGKDAVEVHIPTQTPYTWQGFEDFLFERAVLVRIDDYKSNKDGRYADFADIISRIDKIIWRMKYEGAVVGAFNHNIIARDLGLADSKKLDHTTNGEPITGMIVNN